MPLIEVDPDSLGGVADRLLRSVEVAEEVKDHAGSLKDLAQDCGHGALREAVHSFLDAWGYGCGCLMEDARQVADRLAKTTRAYLDTEAKISQTASDGL
jgi:hypothetical protein